MNKELLIGLVLFAGVVTGMLSFSATVFDQYGSDIDDTDEYSRFDSMADEVKTNTSAQLERGRDQAGGLGSQIREGFFMLTGVFQIIKLSIDAFLLVPGIISLFVTSLGLPPWAEYVANSLVTIGLLFGLVAFYRGVRS